MLSGMAEYRKAEHVINAVFNRYAITACPAPFNPNSKGNLWCSKSLRLD